jgi:hypothetical protein
VGNSLQPVQENLDLKMDVECENIENTVEQIFDSFSGSSSSEELINLLSLNDNLPKLVEQYPNALSKLAPTFPDFSDLVTNQGIAMAQDPSLFPI